MCAYFSAERLDFVDDELLHPIDAVFLFESKVEFLFEELVSSIINIYASVLLCKTYRFANGLISWIMPHLEVRVVKCLFAADALGRIKAEHLRKQVDGEGVCLGEEGGEGDARFDREGSNIVLGL